MCIIHVLTEKFLLLFQKIVSSISCSHGREPVRGFLRNSGGRMHWWNCHQQFATIRYPDKWHAYTVVYYGKYIHVFRINSVTSWLIPPEDTVKRVSSHTTPPPHSYAQDEIKIKMCFSLQFFICHSTNDSWNYFLAGHNCITEYTVKLVYKDHTRDRYNVVLIHRWSVKAHSLTWKVYPWGCVQCCLYKQVVCMYRCF